MIFHMFLKNTHTEFIVFCKMVYFMHLEMVVTKDLPQTPFPVISPVCVLLCIWRWIRCEKALSHYYTFIRFPSTVCSFIPLKSTVVSKGQTTLTTFIGVLSSLWSFVFLKMAVLCKGLTKNITIIGFLSRCVLLCNWGLLWCAWPYNTDYIHTVSSSPVCFLLCNWRLFWYAKTLPHSLHS